MGCGGCGSTFRRHGFDSGVRKKVANGSVYPLATYSDCTRMYAASKPHSKKTVMVVARENPEYERIFSNRDEAAKYKRQLQRQGVENKVARVSAVMARDLCHEAVIELFEEPMMKKQVAGEAVQ